MLHARFAGVLLVFALACSDSGGEIGRLPGGESELASTAILRVAYQPRPEDFDTNHPTLHGLPLSFNTLIAAVGPAATVGAVNGALDAIEAEIVGGIPGRAGGLLFLRIPSSDHASMEAALTKLRGDGSFPFAAQDSALSADEVSRPNGANPADWQWDAAPSGGNWGFELSRVPAMWNLNTSIGKTFPAAITGIVDVGFTTSHEDLAFLENQTPDKVNSHGTHVAGIAGAIYDNGKGVDGVNRFARMAARGLAGFSLFGTKYTVKGNLISDLEALIRAQPDVRVVNMSLGYNWRAAGIDTRTTPDAQTHANQDGGLFKTALETLVADGIGLPEIIVSAGNDSGGAFGDQDAKFNSPMCNAGLVLGTAPVIVVEAVRQDDGALGGASRADFSNINGNLSAPGELILSTSTSAEGYEVSSGTSMAAPFVAGLVGYLYALDPELPRPTMTTNAIFDLLFANTRTASGDAKARVDAFDTVVDVDRLQGTTKVVEHLVDIDDGSEDGNLRLAPDGAVDLEEDHDGDTGRGDGHADMSDFRRWRDWYHQFNRSPDLDLDGGPEHPKRDLNGDGIVGTPQQENYPRGDFNGDGVIGLFEKNRMKGVFGDTEVTDLEVLQRVFSDLDYAAADLPELLNSADLHIRPAKCFAVGGVEKVQTTIRLSGLDEILYVREQTAANPNIVVTVPVELVPYSVELEALDATGAVIAGGEEEVMLTLGRDVHLDPECNPGLLISPGSTEVLMGARAQFHAFLAGVETNEVVWSATGGSIDSTGLYTAGQTEGTFRVEAVSIVDSSLRATASVAIVANVNRKYEGTLRLTYGYDSVVTVPKSMETTHESVDITARVSCSVEGSSVSCLGVSMTIAHSYAYDGYAEDVHGCLGFAPGGGSAVACGAGCTIMDEFCGRGGLCVLCDSSDRSESRRRAAVSTTTTAVPSTLLEIGGTGPYTISSLLPRFPGEMVEERTVSCLYHRGSAENCGTPDPPAVTTSTSNDEDWPFTSSRTRAMGTLASLPAGQDPLIGSATARRFDGTISTTVTFDLTRVQ